MRRGMIKVLALKIIGDGEVSGYDLMKRIEKITGRKPSSGTIYPMLKAMADEGWIKRKDEGNRALYSITDTGEKRLQEFRALRSEYSRKIMESMSIAGEAFEMETSGIVEILLPLFIDVKELMESGAPVERIEGVIAGAREELRKIQEEME